MLKLKRIIEESQIKHSIWGLPLLICFIQFMNSCDTCNISGPDGGNSSEKIYFTAVSANNPTPSIYYINRDGSGVTTLINNGIVFSSPSNNQQLCFLRKNEEGRSELYLYDLQNKGPEQLITKEIDLFEIASPILSSDGAKIAFNAGDGRLLVYKNIDNPIFNQISGKLVIGTIPTFSPDSKKIAFFENLGSQTIILKIIDAEKTDAINLIYSKEIKGSILTTEANSYINWSKDSKSIIYSAQINKKNILYINNIENQTEQIYSFDNSEIAFIQPAISPDSKYAVFANKDGNLWIINLISKDTLFFQITNNNATNRCFYPQWSEDGNRICYNMFSDFSNGLYSNLMLAEVEFDGSKVRAKLNMILSNNVYKGFWR